MPVEEVEVSPDGFVEQAQQTPLGVRRRMAARASA